MNLKCQDCGAPITELPFKPAADRPVFCFECNKKRRANFAR
ncbi:MAG: CxxC-x17-CxxC domain-containing protein [Patescibacteria group bacterium]